MARNDEVSLQESHEYLPPARHIPEREQAYERERVYESNDGRGSKSFHREEHSPLRSKRRSTGRKKSSYRSTARLQLSVSDRLHSGTRVHGNRHVGGCCAGHGLQEKPHPEHHRSRSPTDRKRKKKKQAFVSPSRKYAQMNEEREEEFRNYKALVEQRFTQMLEDEKCKLKQQYAEKRDLLEKKVRFENEDRLREVQDQMKQEFAHQQRIAEQRHYDEIMQKERDLKNKLEQEQRRMELESIHREQALEEKVQNRLN